MDIGNLRAFEEKWGSTNTDLATALKFASGEPYSPLNDSVWRQSLGAALSVLGGSGGQVGAQNQDWYYQKIGSMVKELSSYYAEKTKQLLEISPAFDPTKYENTSYKLYDSGQGESANRQAPIINAFNEWSAKMRSLEAAEKAARLYQQTGVIAPYPEDPAKKEAEALIQKFAGKRLDVQDQRVLSSAQNIVSGKPITEEAKATANAAAARVGAPLPYPDGGIGEMRAGGVFQTAEQAKQAYTNGQLNTVGQNIVSSNSAGNMKNGVNQATVNPDGTVSWNGQTFPNINAAALAANAVGVTSLRFGNATSGGATTTGGVSGATPGGATGSTTGGTSGIAGSTTTGGGLTGTAGVPTIDPQAQAQAMSILNKYLNDGTIDNGTYQMFKKAVELWDPNQEVDYANILNTFETIKQTDINPYFREQAALFTNELEANRDYIIQSKVLEDKSMEQNTKKLKEDMQKDLAARGMLFTGESVKQLGAEGSFATEGTPEAQKAAIPTIKPFADGVFQQQTQAAGSASNLRYQKSLQDLQRQAEARLGTANAGVIPGTTNIGGITGSMEREKKQAYGNALTGLYNQEMTNVEARSGQESQIFKE